MKELVDLTTTVRNLSRARLFILESNLPGKDESGVALENGIRQGLAAGDGLQHGLIQSHRLSGKVMQADDSQALVDYLALRRDALALLEPPEAGADGSGVEEAA